MPAHNALKFVALSFFSLLFIGGCGSGGSVGRARCSAQLWVSTKGDDISGNGSALSPFASIDRARLAVRQSWQKGVCIIDVNIEGGIYNLTAPIMFDPLDSGSRQAPVNYRAASGNSSPVVISGGITVPNFSCSSLNICTAQMDNLPLETMPRQFYVNDRRAIRARTNYGQAVNTDYQRVPQGYKQIIPQSLDAPRTGGSRHNDPMENDALPGGQSYRRHSSHTKSLLAQCQYVSAAVEFSASKLVGKCAGIRDPARDVVSRSVQSNTNLLQHQRHCASQRGAAGAGKPDPACGDAPGDPVANISFEGLQFFYATWMGPNSSNGYVADQSGNMLLRTGHEANTIGHQQVVYKTPGNITSRYAHNITFSNDKFIHLGGGALDLDTGSQNNKIINNIFTDISSAAIEVGGFTQEDMRPDAARETSNNLIENNIFSYTGQDYYETAAISVGFTTGTEITHNTISNTPWSAVAIGWGWGLFDKGGFPGLPSATPGMWGNYDTPTIQSNNQITSNLFADFLEQLWDGGAIYTNGAHGQSFANGLLIRRNVAENKRPDAGSNIYYTDGGSQYITLKQNVSINDPVGTVDFGPCGTGSSISGLCALTGVLPYGADMGGCLPVGDLTYNGNYFLNTIEFFGPQICTNSYIPAYPVNLTFVNNVPTTSAAQVPNWILLQAGAQ